LSFTHSTLTQMKYSRLLRSLTIPALALISVSCKSNQGSDPYANSNPYYGPQGAYGDNTTVEPVSDSGGYVAPAPAEPNYTAPAPAPSSGGGGGGGSKNYTVASGDNLYRISLRHGTTVRAIKNANGLTSDVIQPGQRLRIP